MFVYADNAATTRIAPQVLDAMLPYLKEEYGNPSTLYKLGREAKIAIEKAREQVAQVIGAKAEEIFFTGSHCLASFDRSMNGLPRFRKPESFSWQETMIT